MTLSEFAEFERRNGARILAIGDQYWREVRPFFFQPLVLFQEFSSPAASVPFKARLGGFQHALSTHGSSNSRIDLLMFTDIPGCLAKARKSGQIKKAIKHFRIEESRDAESFAREAHPVYVDFHNRCGYGFFSERRELSVFAEWSRVLHANGKLLIYGLRDEQGIRGVSISYLVQRTLIFASSFADTASLKLGAPSLLLHHALEVAASRDDVDAVFATRRRPGKSLDDFYLCRGAVVVSKPAFLGLNPVTRALLKFAKPGEFRALVGLEDSDKVKPLADSAPQTRLERA